MTDAGELASGSRVALPSSLKQIAVEEIRRKIFAREIEPGTKIVQEQLAEQMGMSKIPVREALSALVTEGLVETIPRRGAYVVPLSRQDIEDHYWMMATISGRAAARAAANLSDDELETLHQLCVEMESGVADRERDRLNFRFHSIINHSASSPRMNAVLRLLGSPIPLGFYESNSRLADEVDAEHRDLVDALRARDGRRAEGAMARHFLSGAQYAIDELEKQGFWTEPSLRPSDPAG